MACSVAYSHSSTASVWSLSAMSRLSATTLLYTVAVFAYTSHAWHLAQTGLNETYRVRHLALHYKRVFLSISVPSGRFPTLIESSWPENFVPLRSAIYPSEALHANGNHSDCERIQQAVWAQVDNLERLWVLDIGWRAAAADAEAVADLCPPKLLVFDLLRNNVEVLRIDCGRYLQPNDARLLAVKLGPRTAPCKIEKFVYFLLAADAHILAYDIVEQKWLRRSLISRKYKGIIESPFPVQPIDIAFGRQHELLLSDADGQLYVTPDGYLQSKQLQHYTPSKLSNDIKRRANVAANTTTTLSVELELLGSLLGPSRGMMIDPRSGALFYAVPKFGAVVRCAYQRNLTTQHNEIIYFTSKHIQQIFFGVDAQSVWLLTNRTLKPEDHCFANI